MVKKLQLGEKYKRIYGQTKGFSKMKFDSIITKGINWFLGVKGNIVNVKFEVEGKIFEAYVPDDQYWGCVKDILLNREYEYFSDFEIKRFNGLIVDAGAHVGLFSLVCSVFSNRVIAVEPHPINYNLLNINLIRNGITNVTTINKALWHNNQNLKLYEGIHSGDHTALKASNKYYEVSTITIQEIVKEFGEIDLLKLDVEGAEFNILKDLDGNILRQINCMVVEIHQDKGNINIFLKKLGNYGFSIKTLNPPIWKKEENNPINLHALLKLKILRNILYNIAFLLGFKDKFLQLFYASQLQKIESNEM